MRVIANRILLAAGAVSLIACVVLGVSVMQSYERAVAKDDFARFSLGLSGLARVTQGGSIPMYELVLDRATVGFWWTQFSVVATVFLLSVGGLWLAISKRRSRHLAVAAGLLCVGSILGIALHTTLSPYAYQRRRLEPAIAVGEEVFRRYEDYRSEHGRYPASIAAVYFPGLDRFDRVDGVRQGLPTCDPFGIACRAIGVETDGQLVVEVHEGLLECGITNLWRDWTCRDHR